MHRYRHFDNEIDLNNTNSSAILPEVETDDPYQIEFSPQIQDYSSTVNKFKLFFNRRTRLERYLFFFIILLLIILFLINIIFISYHKKNSINSLCLTSPCIELSYSISSGMNKSIDPCENFHEFVCGRWIRTNIIPKGQSTWSTTKELAQKNMILLKNILEQTSTSSLSNAEQQTMKFYKSCMNTTEIDRLNLQPLEQFFQNILNFTIKQWRDLDKNQTWQQLFIDLTIIISKYPLLYVLPIKIEPDEKNSSWNNIHIDQPRLGLDSRDYYINSTTDNQTNTRNQIIRDTYKRVGSDILQLLGFDKTDSIQRMNDIIQFETELAIINLPMEILQKPSETYSLMTLKQLQEQYQSIGFDVYSFFKNLLNINSSNPIEFNDNDQIIVLSLNLMSNVSNILTKYLLTPEKSHIVIDYLLLSLVLDLSRFLSSDIEQIMLLLKKELFGTDSIPSRWEICVKETDAAFGFALGALYVKTAFGEDDRIKANELIKNIREIFQVNLNKLQWIDQQTKNEAKKKLQKINEKIGYPDYIKDQTKLDDRYAGYPMSENEYFNNAIKAFYRERRRSLLNFRQKVDRTEWHMTPRTVNAYYSAASNEIVFPAGILQPPLFHKDLPLSINYGAIGIVIGHEITHGFDNQGREFDADGNMKSWWTKFASDNFENKTKCFINQYSSFAIEGQNENGQRTLGENIADNGGIKLSYLAYQKHKQQTSNRNNDRSLPGLDYNNDQLFFIAFAHTWCTVATSNSMHFSLTNDPHSLARFRILGTVENSDEFSKAFSCKSKKSDKCQLW